MKQIATAQLKGKKKLVRITEVRTSATFKKLKPEWKESKNALLQQKRLEAKRQFYDVIGCLSDRFEADLTRLNDYTLLRICTTTADYKFCMLDISKSTQELLTFLYIDNNLDTQYATHNMVDLVKIDVIED